MKFSKIMKDRSEDYVKNINILKSLVKKNLFGRYKYSFLGFGWHFVMPAIMMFVYYFAFTQLRSNPIPNYWIYLGSGIFIFNFLLNSLTSGSTTIIGNAQMIKKIYFPREIIVLSQAISSFIITLIGYGVVIISFIVTNHIHLTMIMIVPYLILTFLFSLGIILLVSSITVYVRDVQYILSSITVIFYFLTPMYFEINNITGPLSTCLWLNPFTYFIDFSHQILYYGNVPTITTMLMCIVLSGVSLVAGYAVFKKLKTGFVERL